MIYFTADPHFNHSNIIKLCGRPFADVDKMNNVLIQNWNARVQTTDEIYILGDFMFKGDGVSANSLLQRLNGTKYLIRGNHDKFVDDTAFDKENFAWIKDYHVLSYQKVKFVLFHFPIFEWDGYFGDAVHLYGHVHNSGNNYEQQRKFEVLGKRAINVGVDVNGFLPVSIREIMKRLE